MKSPCISLGLQKSKLLGTGWKQTHVEPSSLCWVGGSDNCSSLLPLFPSKKNSQRKIIHQDTRWWFLTYLFFFFEFSPLGKKCSHFLEEHIFQTQTTSRQFRHVDGTVLRSHQGGSLLCHWQYGGYVPWVEKFTHFACVGLFVCLFVWFVGWLFVCLFSSLV